MQAPAVSHFICAVYRACNEHRQPGIPFQALRPFRRQQCTAECFFGSIRCVHVLPDVLLRNAGMLVRNYRSHQQLLELPSRMFYQVCCTAGLMPRLICWRPADSFWPYRSPAAMRASSYCSNQRMLCHRTVYEVINIVNVCFCSRPWLPRQVQTLCCRRGGTCCSRQVVGRTSVVHVISHTAVLATSPVKYHAQSAAVERFASLCCGRRRRFTAGCCWWNRRGQGQK